MATALGVPRRTSDGAAVALTFDDGPHAEGTPAVLGELERAGATATFFAVGEQVRREPGLVREIVAAGHRVEVHADRHRNQLRLTPTQFAADLDRATAAIADATGDSPRLYRPPYGIFSPAGLALVRRRGLQPWLWSRWGHDWRASATPPGIARELLGGTSAGDVLLLHDADHYSAAGSWRATAASLPLVLDGLARAGLVARALG
jgi:peptidoglycan-N-acetylglucosamine deacetylase